MTLDDLIALNQEIAALTRAGVPLERGLADLGGDLPGRLGSLATALAERAARGEPWPQMLAEQAVGLPPVYRAVVEAGLRAGRLSAALEALAAALRRVAETRRAVITASLYPLLVVLFACGLFAFLSAGLGPALASTLRSLDAPQHSVLGLKWAGHFAVLLPLAILLLAVVWWYLSRRAATIEHRRSSLLLGWLPWVGETLRCSRTAAFAEVLALLVEHDVPLPSALILAADACGDFCLMAAARQLAQQVERGENIAVSPASDSSSGASGNVSGASDSSSGASGNVSGASDSSSGASGNVSGASGSLSGASGSLSAAAAGGPPPGVPTGRLAAQFPPLLRWLMAAGQRQGALSPALRHAAESYRRRARRRADLLRVMLPVGLTVLIGGGATALFALSVFVPYATMLRALAGVWNG